MTLTAHFPASAKVTVPERQSGYLPRRALLDRLRKAHGHRLIAIRAPCGFGKTALLADYCDHERQRGVHVAWVTLDDNDTPDVLETCMAYSFERGGLDSSVSDGIVSGLHPNPTQTPIVRMLRAIESHREQWLLVLDEAERLADLETVQMINVLLADAPASLRVAIAYRNNPGIDVAKAILAGQGIAVTDAELRFSRDEIAQFLGGAFGRRELETIAERTEGWPVALRVYRDTQAKGDKAATALDCADGPRILVDYCNRRLLRGLSPRNREFLLNLALFDSIDPVLVDEVLEESGSRHRIDELAALRGLLHRTRADANHFGMNPLVRECCASLQSQSDPDRSLDLHRRIARTMAARGDTWPALRHAANAADYRTAGEVLECAGGVHALLREGLKAPDEVERFLTPEIRTTYPRLALTHCLLLLWRGRLADARRCLDDVRHCTEDFTRDRAGGDDRAVRIESFIVQAMLLGYQCARVGGDEFRQALAEGSELACDPELPPETLGVLQGLLCVAHYQMARFEAATSHGLRAQESLRRRECSQGAMYVDFQLGMIAMAAGRVQEAADRYAHGRRLAEQISSSNPTAVLVSDVLLCELHLERNDLAAFRHVVPDVVTRLREIATSIDIHAAAFGVVTELMLARQGSVAAAALLEDSYEQTRALGLESVARYLAALRVSVLVADGQVDRAADLWCALGLPESDGALIDLDGQTWREMEALACARIELLAAHGDRASARSLANRFCDVATERGLVRSLMRGLAAVVAFEHRAGKAARAEARMTEFLRLARGTDYLRPLVRKRNASIAVLGRLRRPDLDEGIRESAVAMIARLEPREDSLFNPREINLLTVMAEGEKARAAARRLGISENSARHHLKNLYRKLNAKGKREAIRLAQELGALPYPGSEREAGRGLATSPKGIP